MMDLSRRRFLHTLGALATAEWLRPGLSLAAAASQAAARPNILLFLPDEWRHDWLGTNPDLPLATPNLCALSARGMRFTHCITPSPLCVPARACLASGREYVHCGTPDNSHDYPVAQTTFYTRLRDAGYHVMGVGKFDLNKASADWGTTGQNHLAEWGFSAGKNCAGKPEATDASRQGPVDPYMQFLYDVDGGPLMETHIADMDARTDSDTFKNTSPTPLTEAYYCDNWLARDGIEYIKNAPAGKPWFMQVNFVGPHYPMDITSTMKNQVASLTFPQPVNNTQPSYTPALHNAIRQNYAAMMENIDFWLGEYVKTLTQNGQLDNTLIVFASDHGEMLGDQNLWRKSVPYQASVGVPLIAAGPGVAVGRVSSALISLMDLAATFLDYGGLAHPAEMDSYSFRAVLEGRTDTHRRYVFSQLKTEYEDQNAVFYDWKMVFDGQYKYIEGYNKTGDPALFDMTTPESEKNNIAAGNQAICGRLSAALATMNSELKTGVKDSWRYV